MLKTLRILLFTFFTLPIGIGINLFAQPINDDCFNAIAIGPVDDEPFSTEMATTDGPNHPNDCLTTGASPDTIFKDVWYLFTPDFTGNARLSLCGTANFDTRVAVYNAGATCPVTDEDLLACNDDGPGCTGATSQTDFLVESGSSYLLRIGGWADGGPGPEGTGTFNVFAFEIPPGPPNQFCQDAEVLMLDDNDSTYVEFNSLNAATDGPFYEETFECFDVPNLEFTVYNSVWYEWTATFTGWVDWSNCGTSNFDSRMAVYGPNQSCPPDPFALVACNDDGLDENNFNCPAFTSRALFPVQQDSTYLFSLGGWRATNAGMGSFILKRTLPLVPPENDDCFVADTAWVLTPQQADDFDAVFEGFTSNATYVSQIPKPICRPSGEFLDVYFEFNSGNNTELEIRFNKVTPNTEYVVDLFESCLAPVDTAAGGFCIRTDLSTENFQIWNVDGLPGTPTDYFIRVSTRITSDAPGEFWFQLVGEPFNPVSVDELVLNDFTFAPNPLTNNAYVEFDLDEKARVDASLLNVLGQVVETYSHGILPAGAQRFDYSFDNLKPGIYFYNLQVDDLQKTIKVVKN